jgi:N-acetylglucosamine-6-sulfatase
MLNRGIKRPPMYTHEGVAPEPPEPHRNRDRSPGGIIRDQMRSIAAVDEGVGQLYAALERLGELDNTIFIYTSDNGFLLDEHGQFNTKRRPYEPNLRVPFLVRYPPLVAPGNRSTALIGAVDVAPTLLELADVESVIEIQGQSFAHILADPTAAGRDELLAEYFYEKVTPQAPAWQAIRTPRWKYIEYDSPDAGPTDHELYDLSNDPDEQTNLIASPEHQATLVSLRSRLDQLLEAAQ